MKTEEKTTGNLSFGRQGDEDEEGDQLNHTLYIRPVDKIISLRNVFGGREWYERYAVRSRRIGTLTHHWLIIASVERAELLP